MDQHSYETQEAQILEHLQTKGPITAIEALRLYGCFRLAARIYRLRCEGWLIKCARVHLPSGKVIGQYVLSGQAQ